jgi:mannose-1-phosphate guanylyltransferase
MNGEALTGIYSAHVPTSQHAWAVILAGGDGTRLQPLTRLISGDARPKQFCPIFGGQSLLMDTRLRLQPVVARERTVFSVRKVHERFWMSDLSDVPRENILVQPSNRGTAVGITCAVMHILERDPEAVLCFFPADHYYDDEPAFRLAVEEMYEAAMKDRESVILMGAPPYYPETEYGWMQPTESGGVAQFVEKPSKEDAGALMRDGYLWNTFVMAGRASSFLEMLERCAPQLPASLRSVLTYGLETRRARRLYGVLDPVDFSREVLARSVAQLKMLPLENVRWSDLGKPERVLATLQEAGIKPHWTVQVQKAIA